MPTEAKRQEIDELVRKVKSSAAIYIVEYRGLTVSKSTSVRRQIRAAEGEMKVAKNTLMRIALRESGLPTASEIDSGPNAYVFAYKDAAAPARAIRDFSREKGNEALAVKGGILGNRVISKEQVHALAELPSKEVLVSTLLGAFNGPIQGFVTVLSGPARGLATVLTRIKEQREEAA
ncbi:MAG: 50S ribosomal protein L10 [Synergistaceae bacterium]|jgi:large subunit ribosomal protein L10|nr:50S ribosomal protein L10 [Synergistaceae bacterium]